VWSRRDLLRAAGAGAAAAALAGLGCRRGPIAETAPVASEMGVRGALREALTVLATALTEPVAFARVRRRWRAAVDLVAREVWDERDELVVVAGRDRDGMWRERAIDRVDAGRIVAAARALVAEVPGGGGGPIAIPSPTAS
jgi:hypothetical protein